IKFRSAKRPEATQNNATKNDITKNKVSRESLVSEVVKLERHDVIAIVTVNSPPVNALSAAVRGGILDCMKAAISDPEVKAIVLTCAGRTFIAGADIAEADRCRDPRHRARWRARGRARLSFPGCDQGRPARPAGSEARPVAGR